VHLGQLMCQGPAYDNNNNDNNDDDDESVGKSDWNRKPIAPPTVCIFD